MGYHFPQSADGRGLRHIFTHGERAGAETDEAAEAKEPFPLELEQAEGSPCNSRRKPVLMYFDRNKQ